MDEESKRAPQWSSVKGWNWGNHYEIRKENLAWDTSTCDTFPPYTFICWVWWHLTFILPSHQLGPGHSHTHPHSVICPLLRLYSRLCECLEMRFCFSQWGWGNLRTLNGCRPWPCKRWLAESHAFLQGASVWEPPPVSWNSSDFKLSSLPKWMVSLYFPYLFRSKKLNT